MALTDQDLVSLAFLESVDRGGGLPDGCDVQELLAGHFIVSGPEGWRLTEHGRFKLQELRRMATGQPALLP